MSGMLRMSAADYNAKMLKRKEGRVKNVRKKVIDGIEFHSTGEAIRFQDLCLQQAAGQITGLRRQVPFEVTINGIHICFWKADFVYYRANGERVVEDYKAGKGKTGYRTDIYKMKKKMVEAMYGFRILET